MGAVRLAISWIIVAAFATTFFVTIRALIGRCRIHEKYLSKLFTALILEIVIAGFFIFYHPPPHTQPYVGEWKATIYWYDDYAGTLFNYGNANPAFQPVNPRSEGTFYIYLSKSGVYTGFSRWEAKNGETTLSQLVVIPGDFEFDRDRTLRSVVMKTAFRSKVAEFSYASFTRYRIRFYEASACRLRGKMIVYWEGQEREVGEVLLEQ